MSTAVSTGAERMPRAVPVHTRTEVLGLGLVAGALALTVVAALVTGMPMDEAAFLIPMAILPAVGAALAWRYGTWGRAVGLVLGLAAGVMTFWMIFGLFVPASFVEFTSAIAFVLGVPLMIGGMVTATRHRTELLEAATPGEVRLERGALGIVGLAFLLSLTLWVVGRTSVDVTAAAGVTEAKAANFAFTDVTTSAVDGQVSLVLRNSDAFAHTFTIDELGVDVHLLPGSSEIVSFAATPGTYTFYCTPHSSDGGAGKDDMAAKLTVD